MEINKHEEVMDNKKRSEKQLPNYMKSTSSSVARREQAQVHADHKNLNSSNSSSCVDATSATKSAINLKRKCSFRAAMVAKDSNMGVVSRHTCSSTIKDSKFPKALELSSGATEAEGSSVMRVCRYKYCSLNSHRHDCLVPIKSFVASKRKQLKAQKSMKIKGVSPFRKSVSSKDRKEIDTGQSAGRPRSDLEIISLIEEVGSDFFVEIYCKPQEEIIESVVLAKTSIEGDTGSLSPVKIECTSFKEDDCVSHKDGTYETYEDDHTECELDSSIDHSVEEMTVKTGFLHYESCDDQYNVGEEKLKSAESEDNATGELEGYRYYDFKKDTEGLVEDDTYAKVATFEAFALDLEDTDNTSHSSADFSDDISTHGNLFENDYICTEVNVTPEVVSVASEEVVYALQSLSGNETNAYEHKEMSDLNIVDSEVNRVRDEITDCEHLGNKDNYLVTDKDNLHNENEGGSDLRSLEQGKGDLFATQISASIPEVVERENKNEGNDETQTPEQNIRLFNRKCRDDDISNQPESHNFSFEELLDEIDKEMNCLQLQKDNKFKGLKLRSSEYSSDGSSNLKLKMSIMRKVAEKMDEMREFNPRGPNFLPEELDPEAEKVDLRHQTIDERKNAEEWMVDYALQRAVLKLATARRQKVALLVEAFETVSPVPSSC